VLSIPKWFKLGEYNVVYGLFTVDIQRTDGTLQLCIYRRTAMQQTAILFFLVPTLDFKFRKLYWMHPFYQ